MNRFVIFVSIAIALCQLSAARPDLSLGYKYHQGHSSGGGAFLSAPAAVTTSSYSPTASGNSYFSGQPTLGQLGNVGYAPGNTQSQAVFGGGPSYNTGFGNGGVGFGGIGGAGSSLNGAYASGAQPATNYDEQQAFLTHLQNHQAPIVNKHFYIHSAPVDHDEQQIVRYINIGRPQKNYRVVFIDAPSSTASKAKIIANVAPNEEKTAIYVLSKKSNALDVSAEVVTPAPVQNKPEVFFIKYKTPEEAIHAQHTIQAQYDSLGGSSDVSNEGVVPVSSVIGSLDGTGAGSSNDGFAVSGDVGSIGGGGGGSIGGGNTVRVITTGATADGSSNIGAAVPVVHTGDNTQATYLPPKYARSVKK